VILRDYAGYDDTVVLHEWGHYIEYQYWGNQNPTGTHALAECNQNLKLAFPEGRASWFGNSVKRFFNRPPATSTCAPRERPGPGGVQNWFDLEGETQYPATAMPSEVSIAALHVGHPRRAGHDRRTPGVDDSPATPCRSSTWSRGR
jgi:hypothetical protein